jgi:hypothetical protein
MLSDMAQETPQLLRTKIVHREDSTQSRCP